MSEQKSAIASTGVEALIERLKNEGISAGQDKAADIVLNAQKRAEWIVQEAEQEAELIRAKARQEADSVLQAGKDALQLAARDAFIRLRDMLLNTFSEEVGRVVGQHMKDEDFLRQVILAMAGAVREKAGVDHSARLAIELPQDVIGVDELKRNPEALEQGALSHLTVSLAGDMLRQGIHFSVSNDLSGGLRVRLEDEEMCIDFTDETVAALLLEHIQPRFRALLQGIVK